MLKRAIGILEAKRWRRDLDAGRPDDEKSPNRVPSGQIINYLIRAEQPWGILTNGAEWRLYWRDADFADSGATGGRTPLARRSSRATVGAWMCSGRCCFRSS